MKILKTREEITKGLMGFQEGEVILVLPKKSKFGAMIHTFFCKKMIIAWLDENKRVVDVRMAKPWRIYIPKKAARYVYETTNLKKKIKIGDKIHFTTKE